MCSEMRPFMVKILDDGTLLDTLFIDTEDIDSLRRDLIRDILHDGISLEVFCLIDSGYRNIGMMQSSWDEVFFCPYDDPGTMLRVDRYSGRITD